MAEKIPEEKEQKVTTVPSSAASSAAKPKTQSLKLEDLFKLLSAAGSDATAVQKPMEEFKFWKTQPVLAFDQQIDTEGPIDSGKTPEDISKTPSKLIDGFEWTTVDVTSKDQLQEVYDLLYGNYIEDSDSSFRFKYSAEFLSWALKPPGWNPEWNVGVRVQSTGKLVAFISGVPSTLRVRNNPLVQAPEINFLCVHKKLRSKRLTPLLIREVTRRINLTGVWQALYTAGIVLPSPITSCRYYHRPINWTKLCDVGFSALPPGSTPAKMVAKYALPLETTLPTLRYLEKADIPQVLVLLTKYLDAFDLSPSFTEQELEHWLLGDVSGRDTSDQVIYSYVITDPKDPHIITDLISFYNLESTVLGNTKYDSIKVAYSYYFASTAGIVNESNPEIDIKKLKKRLIQLYENALILAKNKNFDVFNALTLQHNPLFLDELKFGPGDGYLHYYLFNYKAFPIPSGLDKRKVAQHPEKGGIGVVML